MEPAFIALAQAIGAAYITLHNRDPAAYRVPHKGSAPVTQQNVNALVDLDEQIKAANFGDDTQAAKRASLHWLILFEQMKFKQNMQSGSPPPGWDALRTISHERLRTVNREEIEDFIA